MKSSHYMLLLLNCQQNQGLALLETASPQQVIDISKVIFNLNANRNLLQPKTKSLLTKNKKLIIKLSDKKISQLGKYRIIRNNAKALFGLLKSSKNVLEKVLEQ